MVPDYFGDLRLESKSPPSRRKREKGGAPLGYVFFWLIFGYGNYLSDNSGRWAENLCIGRQFIRESETYDQRPGLWNEC